MSCSIKYVSVSLPDLPTPIEPVACRAVTDITKPDVPAHLGEMLKSPYKPEFNAAHFKNYDKLFRTGTWSAPVLRSLLPRKAVILPPRSVCAVKSTEVDFF
jgi:hypothetical protein